MQVSSSIDQLVTSEEYELYQSDFEDGTYRIPTPGTYKIMEDIMFDFKTDYENPTVVVHGGHMKTNKINIHVQVVIMIVFVPP